MGGGAGVISRYHAEHLALLGHRITLVTSSPEKRFSREQPQENFELIRLPSRRKNLYRSSLAEKTHWMQLAKKYLLYDDAGHHHICMAHFTLPGGHVAAALHKKRGIPYVVISHGQDIPWFYPRQMLAYHLLLAPRIRQILKGALKTFVQSQIMYHNATRFLPGSSPVSVIPNGFPADFPRDGAGLRRRVPAAGEPVRLLFAGRLSGQKRPQRLIDVAKALHQNHIPFLMTICGDGVLRTKLERRVKALELQSKVSFTGWIPEQKVKEQYAQNHVLLAPSLAEGMSITILEALFNGLYVITTPVSGNQELIFHPSLGAITKNNTREFVSAIRQYLINPPGKDQLKPIEKTLIARFHWKTIAGKYEDELIHALDKQ